MGAHLFNRHTTWAVFFSLVIALGLAACSDVSNAPAPPPGPAVLTITSDSTLPPGSIGIPYTTTLAAAGGTQPFTWNIVGGGTPAPGLTLSSSGIISGTPTTIGITTRTYRVVDSKQPSSQEALKDLTIAVNAVPQPTITTPSPLPNGILNQTYPSTTLTAVGGTGALTWSSVVTPPLPIGLTFNAATATISGTPTATESQVTHTFSVTDSFSPTPQTVSKGLALTVSSAPLPLAITTGSPLPNGTVTQPYNTPLAATGGTPPLTWDLAPLSPALPSGLQLSSTGVLSGTPSAAASVSPVFRVRDSAAAQQTATKPLSITINNPAPPTITTTSLPAGSFNQAYNQTLGVSGGIAPLTWGVISGGLPNGLSINSSTGTISGTATATGTFTFTVRVTDAIPQFDDQALSITITAPTPPQITTSSLPPGTVTQAYPATTLQATGGTPPYTWDSVVSPALPNGLSFTVSPCATATICGVPLAGSDGTTSHTFTVRDSTNPPQTATRTLSLTINLPAPPNITTTSLSPGTVNSAYSQTLQLSGGTAPFTWSLITGDLPPGLGLNPSTGEISGTPSAAGTFNFTPQVTDSLSQTDTTPPPLSITINLPAPPIITTTSLGNGKVGNNYSKQVQATGGIGSLTWTISAGALPPGLNINQTTGVISGVPTTSGTYTFTVEVTDTFPQSDTQDLSITIIP